MERKQRFSIKKLTVGVCSICIGYAFMTGTAVQAQELGQPVSESIVTEVASGGGDEASPVLVEEVADQTVKTEEAAQPAPFLPASDTQSAVEVTPIAPLAPAPTEAVVTDVPTSAPVVEVVPTAPVEHAAQVPQESGQVAPATSPTQASEPEEQAVSLPAPTPSKPTQQVRTGFRQAASTQPSASEALAANTVAFPDAKEISSMNEVEKSNFKTLLLTNFETKADQVALEDIVVAPKTLNPQTLPVFSRYIKELRDKAAQDGQPAVVGTPEYAALVAEATRLAIAEVSAGLHQDAYLETLAPEAKAIFRTALDNSLLEGKAGLTVGQVKADLHELYRGVLYLQQQYSFENGLPQRLIFQPETIGKTFARETAYDRLKAYGTVTVTDPTRAKDQLALQQNEDQFRTRKVGFYTGTTSVADLVERLAAEKNKPAEAYFTEQSQALIGSVPGVNSFEALKAGSPRLILPLLSQGKGVYAATTNGSVTVGLLASYIDQDPGLKNWQKERGETQPQTKFFDKILGYQQNFINFLNDVNKKPIPFTVAVDTMYRYSDQGKGTWSPQSGTDATPAVVNFFVPMKYYDATYTKSKNFNGQSTSDRSMIAFEKRFMDEDLSGISLFTHEMTHSNDEAGLFGGIYQGGGRREGQGAEVYARGIFEVIDNSQTGQADSFNPVFNLNTAITIANTAQRTQALAPHTTKQALETYMRNLMDLVAYLEAKEAEVALAVLTDQEKATYYNIVRQVQPSQTTYATGKAVISPDTDRINDRSTNDSFTPYEKMGAPALTNPTTIDDLVDQDAVSGQFIPRAASPFNVNLTTNQYDNVPLLESFYAASVAEAGQNTVGDISFKRHAYEILGWQGWDAFITYLSDQHSGDQEAFATILADDPQKTWADYKKAQYQRLSALEAKDQLWDTDTLKKELEAAIKKDLAVISTLKTSAEPHWANQATVTEGANPITALASSQGFRDKATNVRAVKLDILRKALAHNDLSASVLESPKTPEIISASQTQPVTGNIIYVNNLSNGDGSTPDTAMKSIRDALLKAKDGDTIRLVGNMTDRTPLIIDKAITIDSDNPDNSLWLNEDLTFTKDVTIRGLVLNINKDSQAAGHLKMNGGHLTLDNLSTKGSTPPKVLVDGSQAKAALTILNPRETVLDSMQTAGQTAIVLDGGSIRVSKGIQALPNQTGQTTVETNSNFVTDFKGTATNPMTVTFDGSKLSDVVLQHVDGLTLLQDSRVSLSANDTISLSGDLTLASQATLDAGKHDLTLDDLDGEGTVKLASSASLVVNRSHVATKIVFTHPTMDYSAYKGKAFVRIAQVGATEPTVELSPRGEYLANNGGGQWIYQAPVFNDYRLYYLFTEDSVSRAAKKFLVDQADQLLPGDFGEDFVAINEEVRPAPINTVVIDNDGIGQWRFVGWTPEVQQITQDDMEFVGIWRYEVLKRDSISFETDYVAAPDQPSTYRMETRQGQLGVSETVILADGSIYETRQVKTPENRVITVGTKEEVLRESLAPSIVYQADANQPAGQRTEVLGQPGERVTRTTYTLDTKTGVLTPKTEVTEQPATSTLVKLGTQATETRESLAPSIVYRADANQPAGQRTEVLGQPGERVTRTTYTLDTKAGVLTPQTEVTEQSATSTIIMVGIQSKVEKEDLPITSIETFDDQLDKDQRVTDYAGKAGQLIRTTTYQLDLQTGQLSSDTKTERVEGEPARVRVGSKTVTTRVEPIAYQTLYQADASKPYGFRETTRPGQVGERTITVTNGLADQGQVTKSPVDELVTLGTAPTETRKSLDFATVEEENPLLPKGQRQTITPGQPGEEVVTTRYQLDAQTGQLTPVTVITSRTEPIPARVQVGTWETLIPDQAPNLTDLPEGSLREETISYETTYVDDASLRVGQEEEIQAGQDGLLERAYVGDTEVASRIARPARPRIVRRGTWEVVIPDQAPSLADLPEGSLREEAISYETTYVDDASLRVGQEEEIQAGQDGLLERAYVGDQEVSSRTIRDARPRIVRRGTWEVVIPSNFPTMAAKPEAVIQEEVVEMPVRYIDDASLPAGTEIVEQAGRAGRQTRILINGMEYYREVIVPAEIAVIRRSPLPPVESQLMAEPRKEQTASINSRVSSLTQENLAPTSVDPSTKEVTLSGVSPSSVASTLPETGQTEDLLTLYGSLMALLLGAGLVLKNKKQNKAKI